jgi:hypothetical protein
LTVKSKKTIKMIFQNTLPSTGAGEGGAKINCGSLFSKYGVKLAGIGGGIGAIFFGFWSCFTIHPLCILAGILQICAGLLIIGALHVLWFLAVVS